MTVVCREAVAQRSLSVLQQSCQTISPNKWSRLQTIHRSWASSQMAADWSPWRRPVCAQGGALKSLLRVDGDDFAAAASDQQDPV